MAAVWSLQSSQSAAQCAHNNIPTESMGMRDKLATKAIAQSAGGLTRICFAALIKAWRGIE